MDPAAVNSDGEPGRTCFFTYKELRKATNKFKKELGRGGYGSVYLGKLKDKRPVAVKVIEQRTKKTIEQFNNEVRLLSLLRHKNLVAFYGCTKPPENLLLVYEFVPNRTVAYHLHVRKGPFPLSLRMQIAIEIAEGLLYLHSAKFPVVHRDVKTENMLLDNAFHVKVADFGLSRLLPTDGSEILTVTPGTAGYQDPEYKRVFKLTDKSDVYSFGVVLLEFLSRRMAVDVDQAPDKIFLEEIGPSMIMNGELEQLVDPEIGYSDSEARSIIDLVADLANKCLQPKGVMRPPMVEVLRVLKEIDNQMRESTAFMEMESKKKISQDEELLEKGESSMQGEGDSRPLYSRPFYFGSARIYSYEELKKATDLFNPSRLLDKDGFGSTYLGKLLDGQMVAVKVLFDVRPRRLAQFFNEVTVHYRLHHENLVTLYGCTNPRDKKLLLVYKFVPNGTLADHLHGDHRALTWDVRMQVAIQTAEALVYLHSLDPTIIHRDVTTSNILLDKTFHVEVTGLTICRLLPLGTTHISTAPQGAMGYRDPEYDHTFMLSDKSDVYSFGVVLVELISGQKAVDVNRRMDEIYLDHMFLNKIIDKKLDDFVDPKLHYHSDNGVRRMIDLVVDLARECLQLKGDDRPPMLNVLKLLKETILMNTKCFIL